MTTTRHGLAHHDRNLNRFGLAKGLSVAVGVVLLSSCAGYQSMPLPEGSGLISDSAALSRLNPAGSNVNQVNVQDGMDMDEVAVVAVVTNPDLIAIRTRLGVAQAQLFATRLLPDPQIALGVDRPTSAAQGLSNAKSASLNYDLLALLTRSSAVRSQRFAAQQVRLEVVWQEWQVAQQARWLYVRASSERQKLALLRDAVSKHERRQAASAKALSEGNLTIEKAGPDLTALLDLGTQLYQLRREHSQTHRELNALLGLLPDAVPELSLLEAAPAATTLDAAGLLPSIIATRPDLLALQAGYASQEANVRKATLRFFPALAISLARAVDTSAVYTSGFGLSLDLPIFTGNRGEVRIEQATRAQLWSEYQARLAQTHSDVSRLLAEQRILSERREFLRQHVPELARMVAETRTAYETRDIDALLYLDIESGLINKQIEIIDLEQALWEIAIALDTITARVASA